MSLRIIPQLLRRSALTTARNPALYGLVTRQSRNLHFTRSTPHVNSSVRPWIPRRLLTTPSKSAKGSTTQAIHETTIVQTTQAKVPGKLRQLMQQYGVAGIVVYLGVGMVDLGATYMAIQFVGADKVKELEKWIKSSFGRFGLWSNEHKDVPDTTATTLGVGGVLGEIEAEVPAEGEQPSMASIFILAYGIHKTLFLPFRLGVTAAITPWVVRRIQALGWNIGRKAL